MPYACLHEVPPVPLSLCAYATTLGVQAMHVLVMGSKKCPKKGALLALVCFKEGDMHSSEILLTVCIFSLQVLRNAEAHA